MKPKSFALVFAVVVLIAVVSPSYAEVTKIQITMKESPTFGGYSWPGVGQYEKIVGKVRRTRSEGSEKFGYCRSAACAAQLERKSGILVRLLHPGFLLPVDGTVALN